jgi:hypothetical protein
MRQQHWFSGHVKIRLLSRLVTTPYWWSSKALQSLLDYRDRTDLPVFGYSIFM